MGDFIYQYDDRDKSKLCKYFKSQGGTIEEICRILNLTEEKVNQLLEMKSRRKYPEELYVQIEKMFLLTGEIKPISEYLDIPYKDVYSYLYQKNFIKKGDVIDGNKETS